MSIAKPFLALRTNKLPSGGYAGVSILVEATREGNLVIVGEQMADIQRQIADYPNESFVILQTVSVAEPERKPTHTIRSI